MRSMMISADEDGIITAVEGDVAEMLGYDAADLIGEDIEVVVPPKYHERHHSSLDNYVATGKKKAMGSWVAVEALHRSGEILPVMLVVTERDGVLQGILEER